MTGHPEFSSGFSDFVMPEKILVLDTETTGLKGARFDTDPFKHASSHRAASDYADGDPLDGLDWSLYGDAVVDIGICEADLKDGTVRDIYSSVVGYDTSLWTDEMKSSWVFENTDMTVGEVESAKRFSKVRREVADVVKGRFLTTYNVQFDLDKFLYMFPWNLKGSFIECRDIMFSARDICKLENPHPGAKEYRYPKLEYAYEMILEGEDPAGIKGVQDHRALSDARVASYLLIRMNDDGLYRPMDYSGRHGQACF